MKAEDAEAYRIYVGLIGACLLVVAIVPLWFETTIPWWGAILLGLLAVAGGAYCWLAIQGSDRAVRKYTGGTFGHPAMIVVVVVALAISAVIERRRKAGPGKSK